MGMSYTGRGVPTNPVLREMQAESRRMDIANKIAMVIVDDIAANIIRPGPKPEERECYIVAQELRDHSPEVARLVAQVLEAEGR